MVRRDFTYILGDEMVRRDFTYILGEKGEEGLISWG